MNKIAKDFIHASFLLYVAALAFLLFFNSRGYIWEDLSWIEYMKYHSNFVPFRTISTYILALVNGSMNIDIPLKNLLGNIVMFMPMGLYLPYYLKKIQLLSVFFFIMILLLLAVEWIQLVTRRGSFDIDDLLLNMFGALLGFFIWKRKWVQRVL